MMGQLNSLQPAFFFSIHDVDAPRVCHTHVSASSVHTHTNAGGRGGDGAAVLMPLHKDAMNFSCIPVNVDSFGFVHTIQRSCS